MKKLWVKYLLALATAASVVVILGLGGCAAGFGGNFSLPAITLYSLVPANPVIQVGQSLPLVVAVEKIGDKPFNDAPTNYDWSSSNPGVATVDANGLVKALAIGTSKVKAVKKSDHGKSAETTVTVAGLSAIAVRAATPATMAVALAWGSLEGDYVLDPATNSLRRYTATSDDASVPGEAQRVAVRDGQWLALDAEQGRLFVLGGQGRELHAFGMDAGSGRLTPLAESRLTEPLQRVEYDPNLRELQGTTRNGVVVRIRWP